jgi:agarase
MKIFTFIVSILLLPGALLNAGDNKGFTIQKDPQGKFWFVDPAGNKFLSIGINNIVPKAWGAKPNSKYYHPVETEYGGDFEKWNTFVTDLLLKNNFNTIGSWSDPGVHASGLYSTVILYVAGYADDRCLEGLRPDFEKKVEKNIQDRLSKQKYTDAIMGFYLDNEMKWFGKSAWDVSPNYTLLELAMDMPAQDSARQEAKNFLIKKYQTPEAFAKAWNVPLDSWDNLTANTLRGSINSVSIKDRDEFTEYAAEKYFSVSAEIARKLMPGKLILGVRFAGDSPDGVIKACGRHCDVISYNKYQVEPDVNKRLLARYWILGQKPVMITEYSWRGKENSSGCLNSRGAGTVVETQAQRAENYKKYIAAMYAQPMVIGTHWFEFADQSPNGRFDGENSNYGVVDIYNKPYTALLDAMTAANKQAFEVHSKSDIPAIDKLPEEATVVFEPGQYPDRPPFVDLIHEKWIKQPELFHAEDASIALEGLDVNEGNLIINFNTGSLWGCGMLIFGPEKYAVKSGPVYATNLDGYDAIEMDWFVPKNVTYEIMADEAGVDLPDKAKYNTLAGDDAESFTFGNHSGSGNREKCRFEFKNIKPRTSWGNQNGQRRFTTNAMKGIGLYVAGGQGNGKIIIYSMRLVR